MNSFPFEAWLRLAVSFYHLSPSEFWAMSVGDWLILMAPQTAALSREDFTCLMASFPDSSNSIRTQHNA